LNDLAKYSMTRSARSLSATAELLILNFEYYDGWCW